MGKIRVLIVDDHPLMRRGVQDVLSGDPELEICGEAEDVADALAQVRSKRPDLVILDVSLPSGSGLELVKDIRSLCSATRSLVLSMHDDAVFAERALRAGALGYINKGRTGTELLAAIRKVLQGEIALSPEMADQLLRRAVTGAKTPERGGGVGSLSDHELEVFELIGRGLNTRDIAERLCVSVKTVEAHREHIKKKLALCSAAELSRHAALWAEGGL